MISVENIDKSFSGPTGSVHVLTGVNLTVEPGALTALMGPSGSGKSTLIRLCAGLLRPDSGRIIVDQQDATALSSAQLTKLRLRDIGVIFQDYTLIPELTAVENVELPLRGQRKSRKSARSEAQAALKLLGIEELASRLPLEMSGGQQQRVGIARALVGGRRTVLADEPTGSLDRIMTRSVFSTLRVAADEGASVLVATHDPVIAEWADHIVHIDGGSVVERS